MLFTGDHLSYSSRLQRLHGFKAFNHGNPHVQAMSISMLAGASYAFQWILPAHGRMLRFPDLNEKKKAIIQAATDFKIEEDRFGAFRIGR